MEAGLGGHPHPIIPLSLHLLAVSVSVTFTGLCVHRGNISRLLFGSW